MKNKKDINNITATQMAHLAGDNMDVMTKAISAFNRKWSNLLSPEECEDLLTEAYLNACEAAWSFNPGKGASLRTWLSTIAHNAAFNAVQRRLRQVRLNLEYNQDEDGEEQIGPFSGRLSRSERDQLLVSQWETCDEALTFEDRRKARLQRECWMAAFHALSDTDQLLLYMRYELKLGEEEMARQRNTTYGALRTALSRAREHFAIELKVRHFEDIDEWTSRFFHLDEIPDWEEDDDETFFGGRSETNG